MFSTVSAEQQKERVPLSTGPNSSGVVVLDLVHFTAVEDQRADHCDFIDNIIHTQTLRDGDRCGKARPG